MCFLIFLSCFLSFFFQKAHSGELVNVLNNANQPVPAALMAFGTHTKKKVDSTYGAFFKDVDMSKKATKITFGNDSDDE